MTDKLIEAVARALEEPLDNWGLHAEPSEVRLLAREAIAAIEASGTHAVVPVELSEANARLISAAPEMLENGQFLLDRMDELDLANMPDELTRDWIGHVEPAMSRFRAILAKARGTT